MKKKLITFLLLMQVIASYAANLKAIHIGSKAGKISLFFSIDKPINHKVFTLTNPNRVVVDFGNTHLAMNLQALKFDKKLIKKVRFGYPNENTLRLVFEVSQAVSTHMNNWQSSTPILHGFKLELTNNGFAVVPSKAVPTPIRQKLTPIRPIMIILDAGHGGKDPGAIGPYRVQEKKVVLNIALKLKQIINKQPGMKAILTREGDYYIGLRERLRIARRYKGDVFISIHADAFKNHQSRGASVFALSQSGATNEAARWLAEKENYSELGGVNLANLDDKSGLVRTVLIDLSQTATIGASLHMGSAVLKQISTITSLHNRKVEQARFMVLKSPDIPSILIETGFISNPKEALNLANPNYQLRLTQAIFQGLKRYFWLHPPYGTYLETLVAATIHIVKKGENLPKIAHRYKVSVSAIKIKNHLSQELIRINQKLLIPIA